MSRNLEEYKKTIKTLSDDELHKEIWMLDIHIQYLKTNEEDDVDSIMGLLEVAKDEQERRVSQRYYV